MPDFTLKLYKFPESGKNFLTEVARYTLQAGSVQEAIAKGWKTQVPSFDNSDFALLFDDQGIAVWYYHADRT